METLPYPFGDELRGVAAASGLPLGKEVFLVVFPFTRQPSDQSSKVSRGSALIIVHLFWLPGEVVLFNIFYEVFTVCTSIVAEDPKGKRMDSCRFTISYRTNVPIGTKYTNNSQIICVVHSCR